MSVIKYKNCTWVGEIKDGEAYGKGKLTYKYGNVFTGSIKYKNKDLWDANGTYIMFQLTKKFLVNYYTNVIQYD